MTQTANIGSFSAIAQTSAAPTARAQERAALEKAAKEFEAIFMRQLMSSMRKASLGEGIDQSSAVEQFQELSDANTANGLAGSGTLGIAQMLLNQLDKQ